MHFLPCSARYSASEEGQPSEACEAELACWVHTLAALSLSSLLQNWERLHLTHLGLQSLPSVWHLGVCRLGFSLFWYLLHSYRCYWHCCHFSPLSCMFALVFRSRIERTGSDFLITRSLPKEGTLCTRGSCVSTKMGVITFLAFFLW